MWRGCFDDYRIKTVADKIVLSFEPCKNRGEARPLEQGSIYTTISAPEGIGRNGKSNVDSFILVNTAEQFKDWRVTPYVYDVPENRSKIKSQDEGFTLLGSTVKKVDGTYEWQLQDDLDEAIEDLDMSFGDFSADY